MLAARLGAGPSRTENRGPYSTSFPLTENPLSEAGLWSTGGLDWTPVRTSGGIAFGTQTGGAGHPPTNHFNDSIGHLLTPYPPNQQSIVTVHRSGSIDSSTREAECLVRFLISGHVARGYEFNYAWDGAYCGIVRWNGALDDFTPISLGNETPNGALADGDLMRLDAIGTSLNAYSSTDGGVTWTLVAFCTDSTWLDGNPGLGFWKDGGTDGDSNLGISNFIARSL